MALGVNAPDTSFALPQHWILVGDYYVHGLMNGKLLERQQTIVLGGIGYTDSSS
jgi:hypothetical protein